VKAFRDSNPREAIDLFTRALQIDPDLKVAEMYLAATYASMSKPGDPERDQSGGRTQEHRGVRAHSSTRTDQCGSSLGLGGVYSNTNNFWKAHDAYLRLTKLSTQDPKAVLFRCIARLDFDQRHGLTWITRGNARLIAEGQQNVDIALAINPQYLEAMTYKNLLLRREAELTSDPAKRERLVAEADSLVHEESGLDEAAI
jgi:tetratricopeptide (TPR) repeat protein